MSEIGDHMEYIEELKYLENKEKERKQLKQENEWLHHIIKEVREYINENEDYFYNYPLVSREHLLEILDKENI